MIKKELTGVSSVGEVLRDVVHFGRLVGFGTFFLCIQYTCEEFWIVRHFFMEIGWRNSSREPSGTFDVIFVFVAISMEHLQFYFHLKEISIVVRSAQTNILCTWGNCAKFLSSHQSMTTLAARDWVFASYCKLIQYWISNDATITCVMLNPKISNCVLGRIGDMRIQKRTH